MGFQRFRVTDEDIELLKQIYLNSDYVPIESSPDWLLHIGKYLKNDLGVLALLGPVGVNIESENDYRERLFPDSISINLAGLCEKIRQSKAKVSVGLPPFGRDLSLFLACTSVLNKVFEFDSTNKNQKNKGVLIVSPDISIRSKYCDLMVDNELLESAFPGSRLLFNGKLEALNKQNTLDMLSGVSFFLPHRRTLPKTISNNPDLIILDLRYSRLNSKVEILVEWICNLKFKCGVIALYSSGDRICRTTLSKQNFQDFPFDHCGIRTCELSVSLDKSDIATSSLDLLFTGAYDVLSRKHKLIGIEQESDLKKIVSSLLTLFQEHSKTDHIELNRLRWLFSIYSQMPVPLVWYENAANENGRWVPQKVIKRIGSNSRDLGKLGPVLQTFKMFFTDLNTQFESLNPKAIKIKAYLEKISPKLNSKNRILILVRDDVMVRALSSWLFISEFPQRPWLEYIDIVSCTNYIKYSHIRYSYFISCGPLHYKYRWILGGDLGRCPTFFVYPSEIKTTEKQIEQFYDKKYIDNRAKRRFSTICSLQGTSAQLCNSESIDYPKLDIELPTIKQHILQKPKQKMTKVSFNELMKVVEDRSKQTSDESMELESNIDDITEDTTEDTIIDYSISEIKDILSVEEGVNCNKFTIESIERGLGIIYIKEHSFVEYIRPKDSKELFRTSPNELEVDDLILVVDENQQNGIFDSIIESAENNPRIQYVLSYRNVWQQAIRILADKYSSNNENINYDKMLVDLKSAGIEITTHQTLRNWIYNVVIGPADLSSIKAVGAISGMTELTKKAKEFDRNFTKVRRLHRNIDRKSVV